MPIIKKPSPEKKGPVSYDDLFETQPVQGSVVVQQQTKEQKAAGHPGTTIKNENYIIHPGVFVSKQTHCRLGVEGGRTLNIGNFNSIRIGVTLDMPSDPENLDQAYNFGTTWIGEKIMGEMKSLEEAGIKFL
jgi:hypothetical protein